MRYGFVIDQNRCIGCHACTVACKEEHNIAVGVNRTWVKYVEKGVYPETRRHFAVLRCNHCDDAPCIEICPTVALFRRPDGIVDFDHERCIGLNPACKHAPTTRFISIRIVTRRLSVTSTHLESRWAISPLAKWCVRRKRSCREISTIRRAISAGASPWTKSRFASRKKGRNQNSSTPALRAICSPRR